MKKMKSMFPLIALMTLLSGCATVAYQYVADLPGEMLSVHKTVARYEGTVKKPCLHMTSLCPDRCDHGGTYAHFSVVEYLDYEKPGEDGDAKQTEFYVRLCNTRDEPDLRVAPALRKTLEELEEGQLVKLDWAHVYMKTDTASWPERIVTKLEE